MISGKAFSDLCKWVVDPRYPDKQLFQYQTASTNELVFINGDYVPYFLTLLPNVDGERKQFVFIIHNSDRSFGEVEFYQLLPFAKHIYAINTTIEHPKLTTIPIGFVDRQLPLLSSFSPPDTIRDIQVYSNFTIGTNTPKRLECLNSVRHVTRKENRSVLEYYEDLCRSQFVLCPEGTGIDTHRIYESLYFGATPVVLESNPLANFYRKFPICIVNSWSDTFSKPNHKQVSFDVLDYMRL